MSVVTNSGLLAFVSFLRPLTQEKDICLLLFQALEGFPWTFPIERHGKFKYLGGH